MPDWPRPVDYLWDAFWDIAQDRQDGPNGPLPLGSLMIKAWCELTGERLTPEEVTVIRAMDAAWLRAYAKEVAAEWRPSTQESSRS